MLDLAMLAMAMLVVRSVAIDCSRGRDVFGFPVLAAACFGFFYVWQPLTLRVQGILPLYLTNDQAAWAEVVAIAAFCSLLAGWSMGRARGSRRILGAERSPSNQKLALAGGTLFAAALTLQAIFVASSGGLAAFYSSVHGAAGDWVNNTAWLYFGWYLAYPGTALLLMASVRAKSRLYWFASAVAVACILANAILITSRGALFCSAAVTGLSPYIALGRRPSKGKVLLAGAVVGCAVLLLVGYREYVHLGASFAGAPSLSEALMTTSRVSSESVQAGEAPTEFLYHAAVIETMDRTREWAYGLPYLYLLVIHPIPRMMWPDKPYQVGLGVDGARVASVMGWTRSGGSAYGLVADFYVQCGVASVLLWFALGFVSRRMLSRATEGRIEWTLAYVLLWAWGLNLFSQDFSSLVVPYLYALGGALLVLRLLSVKGVPPRRAGVRRRITA